MNKYFYNKKNNELLIQINNTICSYNLLQNAKDCLEYKLGSEDYSYIEEWDFTEEFVKYYLTNELDSNKFNEQLNNKIIEEVNYDEAVSIVKQYVYKELKRSKLNTKENIKYYLGNDFKIK